MSQTDLPTVLDPEIEPVEVDLATTKVIIVAVETPEAEVDTVEEGNPFRLPATEPFVLPIVIQTELGPVALRFGTRSRSMDEAPRRTSLADTVAISTGETAGDGIPDAVEYPDVPPWVVAGREPADLRMVASFPWSANPQGMTLTYNRDGGRGGRVLMSTETQERHQEAIEAAFHAFIATNPGMIDAMEKGLALMDARILRSWGATLREVADRQAFILEQGAEMIEELVAPAEPEGQSFGR